MAKKKAKKSELAAVADKSQESNEMSAPQASQTKENQDPKEKPEDSLIQQALKLIWGAESITNKVESDLKSILSKIAAENLKTLEEKYFVLVLWSQRSIGELHLDNIYSALRTENLQESEGKGKKDVLLILKSRGGSIEPAYKISKICNAICKDKFVVVIPREAKSAATLLALGAHEIHMGLLSELGPIDPQIGGLPALGMQDSLLSIARIVKEVPESEKMFAEYICRTLHLNIFGWANRVIESATQYGEHLLERNSEVTGIGKEMAKKIANKLVRHYKDHGFVIDAEEAKTIFDSKLIRENSAELRTCEDFYSQIALVEAMLAAKWRRELMLLGNMTNQRSIYFYSAEEKPS